MPATVYPALTISRRRLTNGCEGMGRTAFRTTIVSHPRAPPPAPGPTTDVNCCRRFRPPCHNERARRLGPGSVAGTTMEFGLVPELLAQDTLFQAVAGVEQHSPRDGLVGQHLDPADVARLVVIGDRRDRALVALEHFDHDIGGVRQQGAAPAPRPE